MRDRQRYAAAAVLIIALIALFIRVWGLWDYYVSPDEALIAVIAGEKDLPSLFKALLTQAHPPLYYFILRLVMKFSRGVFALRTLSLLAGTGLVFEFYFLGRRAGGRVTGLCMSFVAAFGFGSVMLSEVIRQYMLMQVCLTGALIAVLAFFEDGRERWLWWFSSLLTLGLLFHYSAVIPAAGIGLVWFARSLIRRAPRRTYAAMALAYAPFSLAALALYYFHLSRISSHYQDWMLGYLQICFAHDLPGLWNNLVTIFYYLFHRIIAGPAIALFAIGLVGMWRDGRAEAAAVIVSVFAVGVALMFLNEYPFYGARQSFYLLPFAALAVSYGGSTIAHALGRLMEKRAGAGGRRALEAVGLSFFLLASGAVVLTYSRWDYLRSYGTAVRTEFPLKRDVFLGAFDYLATNAKPGDVMLVDRMTSFTLKFAAGRSSWRELNDSMGEIDFRGFRFYYSQPVLRFFNGDDLVGALRELSRVHNISPSAKVWLVSIGFQSASVENAVGAMFGDRPISLSKAEQEGVMIISVPGAAAQEVLNAKAEVKP